MTFNFQVSKSDVNQLAVVCQTTNVLLFLNIQTFSSFNV